MTHLRVSVAGRREAGRREAEGSAVGEPYKIETLFLHDNKGIMRIVTI